MYSIWFWFLALGLSILYLYQQITKLFISRLRADQAPKSDFGIVPVDGFGSDTFSGGVDIIFVHGLGSNPDTTWTVQVSQSESLLDTKKRVCWISDFLPQDFSPTIRKSTRAFFYNHDSYWQRDAVQARLWSLGEGFLQRIRASIRNSDEERKRKLIFVGYSYGGLIIKQALIQAQTRKKDFSDIIDHTAAIFFLGTPHTGTDLVKWGTILARFLQPIGSNPSIVREIAFGSVPIRDLHRDFVAAVNDRVHIVNFFETRKTRLTKLWFIQWDVFCVQEESARYNESSAQNIGLAVDHFGLNKFSSRTTDGYELISKNLLKCLEQVIYRHQNRYLVPLNSVPSYVEREKLLSTIKGKLQEAEKDSSNLSALLIHGLGGTGKTQLALKYIERYKENYDTILWIDGRERETLLSSFARCADELGLSVNQSEIKTTLEDTPEIRATLKYLTSLKTSDRRWLLVMDNVDDLSWGIKNVFPRNGYGSVIITSQDRKASGLISKCESICVKEMDIEEARALLLGHLKWEYHDIPIDVQKDCDTLVEKLGYLPLAVDLAGAYIGNDGEEQKEALAQYLDDYTKHQDELLQRYHLTGLSETDKTVWTVWDKTLSRVKDLEPKSRPDLLLAFLAHFRGGIVQDELFRFASLGFSLVKEQFNQEQTTDEVIPNWLESWIRLGSNQWDSFYYRAGRDLLVRYSLLQRVTSEWTGVTMHGLVQWKGKKYKEDQSWERWYIIFIAAICVQCNEESGRPQLRRYVMSHIPENSIFNLEASGFNDSQISFIGSFLGKAYHDEGKWKEAEVLRTQVMKVRMRVLGEEHPSTLTSIANLAATYEQQGRWDEAEKLQVEVLKTNLRVLGQDHPDTLHNMANLAMTFWHQGEWDKAEKLQIQVMETGKKIFGEKHPSMLLNIANLASTFWNQGRWNEAEKLQLQLVETSLREFGEDHPDTLNNIGNLAATYRSQGRYDEAEKLQLQLMETNLRVLGGKHPDTLCSMANLAITFWNQDKLDEAEKLQTQVLETRKEIFGEEHFLTMTCMANLASIYKDQGRYDEAEKLEIQIIKTNSKVFGEKHQDTLSSISNLAVTLWNQGRWEEAEKLQVQMMETSSKVLGESHPDTLNSMANLAYTWKSQSRDNEALDLMKKCLLLQKEQLGENHPDTVASRRAVEEWEDWEEVD